MDLREKNTLDLVKSLLAETAKGLNEARSAQADIDKTISRLKFNILLLNTLLDRFEDKK